VKEHLGMNKEEKEETVEKPSKEVTGYRRRSER
jgi:hypothetical protein